MAGPHEPVYRSIQKLCWGIHAEANFLIFGVFNSFNKKETGMCERIADVSRFFGRKDEIWYEIDAFWIVMACNLSRFLCQKGITLSMQMRQMYDCKELSYYQADSIHWSSSNRYYLQLFMISGSNGNHQFYAEASDVSLERIELFLSWLGHQSRR